MDVAAVLYDDGEGEAVDALLCAVANGLRAQGVSLGGCVQLNERRAGLSRCAMVIEDLASHMQHEVSPEQAVRAERGCRLDAAALEDVAGAVSARLKSDVALVIVNRFGKQEIAGAGFRPIIETAVANELPVLTAVKRTNVEAWHAFTGGEAVVLPANRDAVLDWCARVI